LLPSKSWADLAASAAGPAWTSMFPPGVIATDTSGAGTLT
jgi:hypothetical protein